MPRFQSYEVTVTRDGSGDVHAVVKPREGAAERSPGARRYSVSLAAEVVPEGMPGDCSGSVNDPEIDRIRVADSKLGNRELAEVLTMAAHELFMKAEW